jgi:transposase
VEPKKRSVGASERDEFLRAVWRAMVAESTQAERFVFVEECSTNVSLRPLYAWSPRGERAHCSAPRNWGKNVTLLCMLCSMTLSGMGPSLAVEGATTRALFEAYVEEALVPSLHHEQVVVMDNLTAHKGERVRELIEKRGYELVFLPSYSPEFNPIEQAFSKVKGMLRGAEARTREALIEAMGRALCAVTAADVSGFFGHCGYRATAQLL